MQTGFIKLHRKILEWQWYEDASVFRYFVHCLLKANYKDKLWKGQIIKRGSFLTSRSKLANELGLTGEKIRRIESKLLGEEITIKTTNKYSVITLVNYEEYNPLLEETTNKTTTEPTNETQTNNKQTTTTKNIKNIKNLKERQKTDFRNRLLDIFISEFESRRNHEFILTGKAKELTNIGRILSILKKKYPKYNSEQMVEEVRRLWVKAIDSKDNFIYQNASPSLIYSKLNQIMNEKTVQTDPENIPQVRRILG